VRRKSRIVVVDEVVTVVINTVKLVARRATTMRTNGRE
jgi:hypothetical protein